MRWLVLALLAGGCTGEAIADKTQWPIARSDLSPVEVEVGLAKYRQFCLPCHGEDATGNGGKTGADFSRPDGPLAKADEVLLGVLREGKKGEIGVMPPQASLLSEAEQRAILAHLRARFGITPAGNSR